MRQTNVARRGRAAVGLFGILCVSAGVRAQPLPTLDFNAKIPGFQGGQGEPSTWFAENTYPGAILQVYGFRPLSGDFPTRFRRTLLRELIQKDVQEARLAAPPQVDAVQIPGADAALSARFVEDYWGTARHRLRIAVYAGGAVALVDYVAHDVGSFDHSFPGIAEMMKTMNVGAAKAKRTPTVQQVGAAKSVAGLYLGSALQFVPSPVLGASTGSGSWMSGTRFYLLSADGRVYRGYRLPKAPGGDIQRFDFENAKAEDPYNSGVFVVESDRVVLRFGGGVAPQEESSALPKANGPLEINGTRYQRHLLK